MIKLIIVLLLIQRTILQSYPEWVVPSSVQVGQYRVFMIANSLGNYQVIIPYLSAYSDIPNTLVSIIQITQLPQIEKTSVLCEASNINQAKFTIILVLSQNNSMLQSIKISYLSYSFSELFFLNFYTLTLTTQNLNNIYPVQNRLEYQFVTYLNGLDINKNYILTGIILGFTLRGQPSIGINFIPYNQSVYIVQINTNQNCQIFNVVLNRFLIEIEQIPGNNIGKKDGDYGIDIGVAYRYTNPNFIDTPTNISFFSQSLFYGILMFENVQFDLSSMGNIFDPQYTDTINVNIGYLSIKVRRCPSNLNSYDPVSGLCYGSCSPYFYSLNFNCLPCDYSCYTCSGPTNTNCLSCLDGWHRHLCLNQCLCRNGFYDANASSCRQCRQAIQGCISCTSASQCIQCANISGCSFMNSSNCNCTTYSISICQQNYIYDKQLQKCRCKQQYYLNNISKTCQRCYYSCYICYYNSTFCFECIDGYVLYKNQCLYSNQNYYVVNQLYYYLNQFTRCVRIQLGICMDICDINSNYYNSTCYGKCPIGTFLINYPQNMCQPCPRLCLQCDNYTVCLRCQQTYYYLSQSQLNCRKCSLNCLRCQNSSYCIQCIRDYILQNNFCKSSIILLDNNCMIGCQYCYINQICQYCNHGYYLTNLFQCLNCSTNGLNLLKDGNCQEICGDGIIINAQCDDKNIQSGDGCSNICMIQENYTCIYKSIQLFSFCYLNNYTINYQLSNPLVNNSIQVKFIPFGINIRFSNLIYNCSFNIISNQKYFHQNNLYVLLQFKQNMNQQICNFTFQNLLSLQIQLSTFPESTYIQPASYLNFLYLLNQKASAILAIIYFIFLMIQLTPYNCLITSLSLNMYVLTSYAYWKQSPIVYSLQNLLQYCTFSYRASIRSILDKDYLQPYSMGSLKILLLYVIIIIIHQILFRILIKLTQFSKKIKNIFKKWQQNNLLTYCCIHTSFQPLAIYYAINIYKLPNNIIGIVCSSIHIFLSFLIFIIIYRFVRSKQFGKWDRKYFYFIGFTKIINIILSITIINSCQQNILTSIITLFWAIIIIIITFLEYIPTQKYQFITNIQIILSFGLFAFISICRIIYFYIQESQHTIGIIIVTILLFQFFIVNIIFCIGLAIYKIIKFWNQRTQMTIVPSQSQQRIQNNNTFDKSQEHIYQTPPTHQQKKQKVQNGRNKRSLEKKEKKQNQRQKNNRSNKVSFSSRIKQRIDKIKNKK